MQYNSPLIHIVEKVRKKDSIVLVHPFLSNIKSTFIVIINCKGGRIVDTGARQLGAVTKNLKNKMKNGKM